MDTPCKSHGPFAVPEFNIHQQEKLNGTATIAHSASSGEKVGADKEDVYLHSYDVTFIRAHHYHGADYLSCIWPGKGFSAKEMKAFSPAQQSTNRLPVCPLHWWYGISLFDISAGTMLGPLQQMPASMHLVVAWCSVMFVLSCLH